MTLAQSPVTAVASATSGLPVSFSSSTPSTCTTDGVNGGTITLVGTGTCTIQADQSGDTHYNPAPPVVQSFAIARITAGAFVIADTAAGQPTLGRTVQFWGAQWDKNNKPSGGQAPASFKGFADSATSACGVDWTSRPGNSSSPPAHLPKQILVVVSSKVTKAGSAIRGDTAHLVMVDVDPGYGGDPGHAGNGTITKIIC